MGWRRPTTSLRITASPTSPSSKRAGSPAATWPAIPQSSAPTTSAPRAPAIYEHALKLWEGLEGELDYPILFSQRGVLNLAHSLQDVRDGIRRVNANQLYGIDAEWLEPEQVSQVCPIVNISPDVRYPVLGATYQPRAGIAKHDHVAWGYARKAVSSALISSRTARYAVSRSPAIA